MWPLGSMLSERTRGHALTAQMEKGPFLPEHTTAQAKATETSKGQDRGQGTRPGPPRKHPGPLRTAPEPPKSHLRPLRTAQEPPKSAQGFGGGQEAPRRPREGSQKAINVDFPPKNISFQRFRGKSSLAAKSGPRAPKRGPRAAKSSPRGLPGCPRRGHPGEAQEPQREPKMAPRGHERGL